jgi:hypothetical protein
MPFLKLFISLTLAFVVLQAKADNQKPVFLSGKYEMHLKINDTVFVDYLSFNCFFTWSNPCLSISLEPQTSSLKGSIEVPNNFTVPIKKGVIRITEKPLTTSLEFEILAKENGREFKVYYNAKIPAPLYEDILSGKTPPTFEGTALLEDNKKLGDFAAVKIE